VKRQLALEGEHGHARRRGWGRGLRVGEGGHGCEKDVMGVDEEMESEDSECDCEDTDMEEESERRDEEDEE
jgi:hypothetical protein